MTQHFTKWHPFVRYSLRTKINFEWKTKTKSFKTKISLPFDVLKYFGTHSQSKRITLGIEGDQYVQIDQNAWISPDSHWIWFPMFNVESQKNSFYARSWDKSFVHCWYFFVCLGMRGKREQKWIENSKKNFFVFVK